MSNFQGYLIKLGADIFPHQYMEYNTYKITPNRRLDLDSARNANGVLSRYVLEHTATTLQFELRQLEGKDQEIVVDFIHNHLANVAEKKVVATYWSPDIHMYKQGEMYIPDVDWTPFKIDAKTNQIWYKKTTVKFIEY